MTWCAENERRWHATPDRVAAELICVGRALAVHPRFLPFWGEVGCPFRYIFDDIPMRNEGGLIPSCVVPGHARRATGLVAQLDLTDDATTGILITRLERSLDTSLSFAHAMGQGIPLDAWTWQVEWQGRTKWCNGGPHLGLAVGRACLAVWGPA